MVYATYLRSHFSISQPEATSLSSVKPRPRRNPTRPSAFCFPFSPAEFLLAASSISSFTAIGPDKVAYPMLKHFPCFGMDFLLIFNLLWTLHSFPSICKASSIIPIHKIGNLSTLLLPFGLSLSPPASQSFLNATYYLVYSSFWNSFAFFLPTRPVSALDGLTLDQILYLSQSISDGFNKPRLGSWTILSTIDFSKAFNSVWHSTLYHILILAGLPPCFARWTLSFLSDRCAYLVYQNHKSRSFRVRQDVLQGFVLGPVLFSLFNDLLASLPSSISCSLYADDLAIWSTSPSILL